MSKTKKLFYILNSDLYSFGIMFCLGMTNKEVIAKVKKYMPEWSVEFPNHFSGCVIIQNPEIPRMVLYLPNYPEKASDYAILQHEIFHATHAILRAVDLPYSKENEEAFAHLNKFITLRIYQQLWK